MLEPVKTYFGKKCFENHFPGADGAAIGESVASQLPGRSEGPADAYRHILWAAEMARLRGEAYDEKTGKWVIPDHIAKGTEERKHYEKLKKEYEGTRKRLYEIKKMGMVKRY